MKFKIHFLVFFLASAIPMAIVAQSTKTFDIFFTDFQFRSDTSFSTFKYNRINFNGNSHLLFAYSKDDANVEIELFPKPNVQQLNWQFKPSEAYNLIDSLIFVDGRFKGRIKYNSLSDLSIHSIFLEQADKVLELMIFPVGITQADIIYNNEDLYIGEEKVFEIISNNSANIYADNSRQITENYEYRVFKENNKTYIAILPLQLGNSAPTFEISLINPVFENSSKSITRKIKLNKSFNIKAARLTFLKTDLSEVKYTYGELKDIEIQLDNHFNLKLEKSYRIENDEADGSALVAEIFTTKRLTNNKVLAILRPYALHNAADGYLYIKESNKATFITNFSIVPEAKINKIRILRAGSDWTENKHIFPDETIEIEVSGIGLKSSNIDFDGLSKVNSDSLLHTDKIVRYMLKVPVNIANNRVELFLNGQNTNLFLNVTEYQIPRDFDFIKIDYGAGPKVFSGIYQPILYPNTVKDVLFSFDLDKIDDEKLYGKQFIEIEIKIKGEKNELVEFHNIPLVELCPSQKSPRHSNYKSENCRMQEISLNEVLSKKTYDLSQWSKIEILIRHKKNRYNGEGYSHRITLVTQNIVSFDIDLSFPAGLIVKRVGVDGFPGLGGISLAMIGQFSFYKKENIQKLRPFKVGVGFLAQNAFNFNPDVEDRDLGIVALGSIYPLKTEKKLSFPLHVGFGYFLNEEQFFYLIGPGITVNF